MALMDGIGTDIDDLDLLIGHHQKVTRRELSASILPQKYTKKIWVRVLWQPVTVAI